MFRFLAVIVLLSMPLIASTGLAKTNLKLRSQPTTESESIGSIPEGSSFEVLDQSNGFYRVSSNGREGYLASKYVEIQKEKVPMTPMDQIKRALSLLYFFFALITGEMMIRPSMSRFFNSLTFFSRGGSPIMMFFEFLEKKVFWEAFVAILSVVIGFFIGPFYVLFRIFKSRGNRSIAEGESEAAPMLKKNESENLPNWPPKVAQN